jgi:hypothetical protein
MDKLTNAQLYHTTLLIFQSYRMQIMIRSKTLGSVPKIELMQLFESNLASLNWDIITLISQLDIPVWLGMLVL